MDTGSHIITKSAGETQKAGKKLADSLIRKKREEIAPVIVCLYGQLGSGKTTFVQGFAKSLGISSRLLSPTFIIVRRYEISALQSQLYHIDLYRIEKEEELQGLGLSEILSEPRAIIFIEWADRLGRLLPKDRIDIQFEVVGQEERKINTKRVKS